jgi:hypothetical protein
MVWQTRDQKFRIENICQLSGNHATVALSSFVCLLLNNPLKSMMKVDAQTILAENKTFVGRIETGRMALNMQSENA